MEPEFEEPIDETNAKQKVLAQWDLILAHAGDRKHADSLKTNLLVFFGGRGAAGDRRAGDAEYLFVEFYGLLKQDRLEELASYFRDIWSYSQSDRSIRPACLDPPTATTYVDTLCVLCQGYLVALELTDEPGPASGSGHVADALAKMGWSDIKPDELGLLKQFNLPTSSFWLEPFGEANSDDIEARLKKEWGGDLPKEIKALVDHIGVGSRVVESETVAKAYLAFYKRLEGVP
jgi:hypothetical protein